MPGRQTLDLRSEPHFCLLQPATQKPPNLGPAETLSRPPAPAFPWLPGLLGSSPSILPGPGLGASEKVRALDAPALTSAPSALLAEEVPSPGRFSRKAGLPCSWLS